MPMLIHKCKNVFLHHHMCIEFSLSTPIPVIFLSFIDYGFRQMILTWPIYVTIAGDNDPINYSDSFITDLVELYKI